MNGEWIYKRKDIDGIYQSMIVKYIAKGYRIVTSHMNGIQSGELNKIDFADGKDIYRIWYYNNYEKVDNEYLDYLKISVHKYECASKEELYSDSTFWVDEGEIIEEQIFYLISNKYDYKFAFNNVYVKNPNYAVEIFRKRRKRHISNEICNKITLSKEDKKNIIEMIKTHHRGHSTLKPKDIDCLERIFDGYNNQYRVHFVCGYKKTWLYLKSFNH